MDPKTPKKSKAIKVVDPNARLVLEQERAAANALKEERIERIMEIMRPVATPSGALTWTRKVSKGLAASWGLEHQPVRRLALEAHKRLVKETIDEDGDVGGGSVKRNLALGLELGLADTIGKRDWKGFAAVGTLAEKIVNRQQQMLVEVKVKEPTPADAKSAVAEMFGDNVTVHPVPQLTDGTDEGGSTPET